MPGQGSHTAREVDSNALSSLFGRCVYNGYMCVYLCASPGKIILCKYKKEKISEKEHCN